MHYRNICKHGRVMSQCRCPGPKADRLVECNHPDLTPDRDEVFDQDRQ